MTQQVHVMTNTFYQLQITRLKMSRTDEGVSNVFTKSTFFSAVNEIAGEWYKCVLLEQDF